MESTLHCFILHLTLLLSAILHPVITAAAGLHPQASDLVSRVCSETAHQAFCTQAFAADHRTPCAELTDLGYISIELLEQTAASTRGYINDLLAKETDPKMQEYLLLCSGYYGEIVSLAGGCSGVLKGKKYIELNEAANQAIMDALGCEDAFSMEPPRPSPLTANNNDAIALGEMVSAVTTLLQYP